MYCLAYSTYGLFEQSNMMSRLRYEKHNIGGHETKEESEPLFCFTILSQHVTAIFAQHEQPPKKNTKSLTSLFVKSIQISRIFKLQTMSVLG